jgi:hypothetical protein
MLSDELKKQPSGPSAAAAQSRARLVARVPSKHAPGSSFRPDWMPSRRSHCGPHAAQSSSGAGPGETPESSVSPEPPSSRAFSRTRRTSGCRRQRWCKLRLCGEKVAGELWSPPA